MPDLQTEPWGDPLPDVTEVRMCDLDLNHPRLAAAIARLNADLDDPAGVLSAFQSFPSGGEP